MTRVIFNEERCKGCGLCIQFCPKSIMYLSEQRNRLGYNYAIIDDMAGCTGCAICALMCPEVIIEVVEEAAV